MFMIAAVRFLASTSESSPQEENIVEVCLKHTESKLEGLYPDHLQSLEKKFTCPSQAVYVQMLRVLAYAIENDLFSKPEAEKMIEMFGGLDASLEEFNQQPLAYRMTVNSILRTTSEEIRAGNI